MRIATDEERVLWLHSKRGSLSPHLQRVSEQDDGANEERGEECEGVCFLHHSRLRYITFPRLSTQRYRQPIALSLSFCYQ